MKTQTEILYELTLVAGEDKPHVSVMGVDYHPIWHIKTKDSEKESQIIIEGLSKIVECTEQDMRFPPAVRVVQLKGEEPKAFPLWGYEIE
ncbi:MAG: hypothetical protein WCI72_05235 [archaeon]